MTQEEILQGNKLIAVFMGGYNRMIGTTEVWDFDYVCDAICKTGEQLLYHSSWEWVIPVIKKFRELDFDNINYTSLVQAIDDAVTDCYDINQVFPEIIAAIKWYNSLPTAQEFDATK